MDTLPWFYLPSKWSENQKLSNTAHSCISLKTVKHDIVGLQSRVFSYHVFRRTQPGDNLIFPPVRNTSPPPPVTRHREQAASFSKEKIKPVLPCNTGFKFSWARQRPRSSSIQNMTLWSTLKKLFQTIPLCDLRDVYLQRVITRGKRQRPVGFRLCVEVHTTLTCYRALWESQVDMWGSFGKCPFFPNRFFFLYCGF